VAAKEEASSLRRWAPAKEEASSLGRCTRGGGLGGRRGTERIGANL